MAKKISNYRLDGSTIELIHDLKESLNFNSNTEVVRRALNLLQEVQKNQVAGGELVFRKPDGTTKTLVFF